MDHGGLIVAAKDYHSYPSKVLKYSCDEGNHWTSFIFSNRYTVVFGVFTEPGETTTVVRYLFLYRDIILCSLVCMELILLLLDGL